MLRKLLKGDEQSSSAHIRKLQQNSFLPQMFELSRNQGFIRYGIFDQARALGKAHQTIDGAERYFGVVKRGVAFDEAGYQLAQW